MLENSNNILHKNFKLIINNLSDLFEEKGGQEKKKICQKMKKHFSEKQRYIRDRKICL